MNVDLERNNFGFTIVELLVVIVVIGILAAITIISYASISQKAVVSSLQSDLTSDATKLKSYYTLYGSYPAMDINNCPTAPTVDANFCLKSSPSATLSYVSVAPTTFHLTDTNSNNSYAITDSTSPTIATTITGSSSGSACPSGFIPVPGSGTYSTNDFCVMKYTASHSDATAGTQGTSTTPISAPSVQQWINVSQTTAITNAPNVASCPTCHLITDAEYLTIVQNVLSVGNPNWSGNVVGSGYIYSGHNDNAPANALVADPLDSSGYAGETNQGGNQKRTLTLTNGQIIWDIAGNLWEWTAGTSTTGQPGVSGGGYVWREWTAVTNPGSLTPNPSPATTGISGANSWNSGNGIGVIYSNADEVALRGFIRGGSWLNGGLAGVLALYLGYAPNSPNNNIGFRVSR